MIPASFEWTVSAGLTGLLGTTYLQSAKGDFFAKSLTLHELRGYAHLKSACSTLSTYLPELLGVYVVVGSLLRLVVECTLLSLDTLDLLLARILEGAKGAPLIKLRTPPEDGCLFLVFESFLDLEHLDFIDLKLGRRTYSCDASPDKRRSQTQKGCDSTTNSIGIRLMGGISPSFSYPGHILPKPLARSLEPDSLRTTVLQFAGADLLTFLKASIAVIQAFESLQDVDLVGLSLIWARKQGAPLVRVVDLSNVRFEMDYHPESSVPLQDGLVIADCLRAFLATISPSSPSTP
ncbi:Inositol hexakisphosphate kinase [Giardia muris]|uniref:Inositol hexakisphosphate kinase n=1 Tax=Giardia muris TaxID=5742 RepID=A0A4Z1T1M0_GIAMU|nr:Inositol hexakisphosphate kinase [Giardia muris]|eukprot:TNJ26261.1 Inositol hexakisphosphate kinase [Giardia muris]